MPDFSIPEYRVSVDLLRPGVFIRIERVNWFKHPFLFNSFKIESEEQIQVLRGLGISEVICVPEQSDRLPGRSRPRTEVPATPLTKPAPGRAADTGMFGAATPAKAAKAKAPAAQSPTPDQAQAIDRLWEIKKERTRRLQDKKKRLAVCEERFTAFTRDLEGMTKRMVSGRAGAVAEALAFVERMAAQLLGDRESTLHLMNVMTPVERSYSHAVNVAVLAMMLGKEAGFESGDLVLAGMGALFHDIGKTRLEKKLLRKRGPLSPSEETLMRRHPDMGREILAEVKEFPVQALDIVARHHERVDGSGYPAGLSGEDVSPLVSAVSIADAYDSLCNAPDQDEALTPYLALSVLFSQHKTRFDRDLLPLFIRCLGVYPPGTVVQLSNGAIGMVMAVNPENQLAPSVVLHDPEIPKKEALIVDLREEPGLKVEKSIRPAHLPPEIFEYLSPRTRITYYMEPEK